MHLAVSILLPLLSRAMTGERVPVNVLQVATLQKYLLHLLFALANIILTLIGPTFFVPNMLSAFCQLHLLDLTSG